MDNTPARPPVHGSATAAVPTVPRAQPAAAPRVSFNNLAASVVEAGGAAAATPQAPAVAAPPRSRDTKVREPRSSRRSERTATATDATEPPQRSATGDHALGPDEPVMTAMADTVVAPSVSTDAALPPTVSDAVLNAEPGTLAMRNSQAPEPQLGPQPVTKAAPDASPKPARPLRASTRIEDVVVRGSLATSVVQRAIARVRPQIADCYRRSAEAAGRNDYGVVRIEVELDERGRARRARAEGGALPGLDACISQAVAKLATRISPDTGTVRALWSVAFEP
jgi:hypothetical protein